MRSRVVWLRAASRCMEPIGVRIARNKKEEFGASFEYVPYVECGVKGDLRAEAQVCKDADIKHFPHLAVSADRRARRACVHFAGT